MRNSNIIENELNKTRERLYEETKNMTIAEHVAYINSLTVPIVKQYGLKTLNQTKTDKQVEMEAVLS